MNGDRDGYDRLEDRVDTWGEHVSGSLADHPKSTLLRWTLLALVVVVALSIIGALLGLFGSWGNEAKRVVSPTNVTEQFDAVITDWQDMQAAADNACAAQESAKQDGDPVMVEDPALAYAATYRRIAVDYNSRQQNIFKAGKVGPPGYPKIAPTVPAKPDWCTVSTQLREVHP